ncbi:ferredoxin NADP+ oxidoreductase FNR [Toxoplasma gondii TgCatPRC2]|uniref:ferredoxin--NADP(+) reductase n=2 Tax=Toxoplasma gondii TaxID=5811 RepID=A0A151HD42_TOXGO|nr:ferredoxin NADP+ oxidoreductase FNR [Toxoplasma gondii ARI]KYK67240.1 ferredoxin NADP+ oxidoreductase FNR [Toxoplasma gondii TgCatPRC2]
MVRGIRPRVYFAFVAVVASVAISVQEVVSFRVAKRGPHVIDHGDTASCGVRVFDSSSTAYLGPLRAAATANSVLGYQGRFRGVSSFLLPGATRQCSDRRRTHCLPKSSEGFLPQWGTLERPLSVRLDRSSTRKRSDTPTGLFATPTDQTSVDAKADELRVAVNTFRPASPLICRVVSVTPVTSKDSSPGDSHGEAPQVFSIVLHHGKQLPFVEGQGIGIMPPSRAAQAPVADESTSQRNSVQPDGQGQQPTTVASICKRRLLPRIYSIASSRDGDDGCGSTLTLCVKKHIYADPVTGKRDRQKDGICSTYICDAKCGDEVEVTGPVGKALLLPTSTETPLVMLATGTGVAPFRSHLQALRRKLLSAGGPSAAQPANRPKVLLFIGARTAAAVPYMNEWRDIEAQRDGNFVDIHFALSRQMKNPQGKKLYIQDVVWQEREKVWKALDRDGGHLYACGLKNMMVGVHEVLGNMAEEKGLPRDHLASLLKHQRRWHVEVY